MYPIYFVAGTNRQTGREQPVTWKFLPFVKVLGFVHLF